jgi:hypothetical protein
MFMYGYTAIPAASYLYLHNFGAVANSLAQRHVENYATQQIFIEVI